MSRSVRALLARARHRVGIAVIKDGKVGWTETQGGSPETLFQAGSISKPVSALVALALVARGEIDLDQEINARLTSWQLPGSTGVSVRDLLGHTAGAGLSFYPGYPQGSSIPTLVQSLRGEAPACTAAVRADPAARGSFSYSGGGYAVLQQLITDVTGVPFWQAAGELVLAPLGMTRSTFRQPLPDQLRPLAARPDWHVYPEAAPAGLWTTPADMAAFCCALQAARAGGLGLADLTSAAQLLLTPAHRLPAKGEWNLLPLLGMQPPGFCGLGMFLQGSGRFSHIGGAHGFLALLAADLDGNGVVVMTATGASLLPFRLLQAVSAEHGWAGYRQPAWRRLDGLPLLRRLTQPT